MEQISEKFSFKDFSVHIYNVVTDGEKWNYTIVITSPMNSNEVSDYKEDRECVASNPQDVLETAKQFAISFISSL